MRQSTQIDSSEDIDQQQRTFNRMLELYYNNNMTTYANMLKKCIPDLDSNYDNRLIRKNDKVWVETNLCKIFDKASFKLQKSLLSRNFLIKSSLDNYSSQFRNLSDDKIAEIKKSFEFQNECSRNQLKRNKKIATVPIRNKSFSIQNVNSEPSYSDNNPRKTLSSRRVFRVRQFKNSLHQTINNTRYIQKLQKVKLESNFAQFFFKKEVNPQESKPAQIERMYFDKIKAMTNIRWNFKPLQCSQTQMKPVVAKQSKVNDYLGFQLRRQSFYKPKSKCQSRNNKLFLNF